MIQTIAYKRAPWTLYQISDQKSVFHVSVVKHAGRFNSESLVDPLLDDSKSEQLHLRSAWPEVCNENKCDKRIYKIESRKTCIWLDSLSWSIKKVSASASWIETGRFLVTYLISNYCSAKKTFLKLFVSNDSTAEACQLAII